MEPSLFGWEGTGYDVTETTIQVRVAMEPSLFGWEGEDNGGDD